MLPTVRIPRQTHPRRTCDSISSSRPRSRFLLRGFFRAFNFISSFRASENSKEEKILSDFLFLSAAEPLAAQVAGELAENATQTKSVIEKFFDTFYLINEVYKDNSIDSELEQEKLSFYLKSGLWFFRFIIAKDKKHEYQELILNDKRLRETVCCYLLCSREAFLQFLIFVCLSSVTSDRASQNKNSKTGKQR